MKSNGLGRNALAWSIDLLFYYILGS